MSAAAMRRPAALGAAVVAAAALAMAAGPGPGEPGGSPAIGPLQAAAADCVPVHHSKTVVKRVKVKRHGRVVRVKRKRKKRWTTCEPPPPTRCAVPSAVLGVTARDQGGSSFTLSRTCVSAGQVTVQLNNQGEDPHNVLLRPLSGFDPVYSVPADPPYELGPLSQDQRSLPLTAGDWYLWCSIGDHRSLGMEALLTVGSP